jgi:dimethylhistidine N-methyltransferase
MLHLATRDDADNAGDDFAAAVLAGLSQPQMTVPARFFYDTAGSELFEAITRLPDYYPTRTEIGILERCGPAIAATVGPGRAVVEFGSGSSAKTPPFLRAVAASAYVPIDISAEFLEMAATDLAAKLPDLPVFPVAADFTRPLQLPGSIVARPKLGFFPGSTLGNLGPAAAVDLLRAFGDTLGERAWLVIGLDLRKAAAILEAAYNDPQGRTAAFNFNVLHRINRELDGTLDAAAFDHHAPFNPDHGRIEMHLRARHATAFTVLGKSFALAAGATIHTENSYKWTLDEARLLARAAGWTPVAVWTDAAPLFAVHLWHRDAAHREP